MNIIEKSYKWNGALSKRNKTNHIIIHHCAGMGSPDAIHQTHLNNGWTGIGYNFYVRVDGTVYTGRPIDCVGAHTTGYNSVSVGVCFEGNYETTASMPEAQKQAGKELISYIKGIYPNATVKKHREFQATACPGKNFPFDEIAKGAVIKELETVNDIVRELNDRGIMTDPSLWLKKCAPNSNAYWLAFKIANMTRNSAGRNPKLESVNDIVWELNYRGIMTDMPLWLKLLEEDKDLYWLAYKAVNMTMNK